MVQHIATVAALQLSMLAHEREMLRREGAETLAEMLQGGLDRAVVARRLAVKGFSAGDGLLLAVLRPRQEAADVDSVADAGVAGTAGDGRGPRYREPSRSGLGCHDS